MAKIKHVRGRSWVRECRLMAALALGFCCWQLKATLAFKMHWPFRRPVIISGARNDYRSAKLSIFVTIYHVLVFGSFVRMLHVAGGAMCYALLFFWLSPYPRAVLVSGIASHHSTLILLYFLHQASSKNQVCMIACLFFFFMFFALCFFCFFSFLSGSDICKCI